MAQGYAARVLEVVSCGEDIVTVRLERPKEYRVAAGQWFRLSFPGDADAGVRTFTNAAAPADNWLELTTRLSPSAFKQALRTLKPEDPVEVSAAGGRLRLPEPHERIAFLVGGVGITPVRSLLRDFVGEGGRFDDALVLYGNRDVACEPYIAELLEMAEAGVRVVRVLQDPPEDWAAESGVITAEMVHAYLGQDDGRPFVVTGPPVMVTAMMAVLDEIGVERDRVVVEAFGTLASPSQDSQ